MAIMAEAHVQKAVMRGLIAISSDYWANFLQYEPENLVCELQRIRVKMFCSLVTITT